VGEFLWCWVLCSFHFQGCFLPKLRLLLLEYNETEPLRQGGKELKTLLRERCITVSTGHPIRQYTLPLV
jgi:hypothetical protein